MLLSVLLVEPYYGGSHRAWADGYARASSHDVALVTHADRFWKWRMQGAAVTLAKEIRSHVEANGKPDVMLVSDMVDVASLLGLARAELSGVVTGLYMHENQLTYPWTPGDDPDLTYAMTNWRSMVAADAVWFNSRFHRDAFLEALPRLLKHFPDYRHSPLIDSVAERISVLPVGVDLGRLPERSSRSGPPLILWNHRWDHDKRPDRFFAALDVLVSAGVDFEVAIAGENFRNEPDEFEAAAARLGDRVVQFGMADDDRYLDLLASADVVVSTTDQENFGIAVVEAIAAGAVPLLPDRLVYPELIPREYHEAVLYADGTLAHRLEDVLVDVAGARRRIEGLAASMRRFGWDRVAPAYDAALAELRATSR